MTNVMLMALPEVGKYSGGRDMRNYGKQLKFPGSGGAQNADAMVGLIFLGLIFFFALRPELSVFGEIIRIVLTLLALGLSMGAAMSMSGRSVIFFNLFLFGGFFALFTLSLGVRIFGMGEWYVPELFEVTLFDVFITGVLSVFFFHNTRKAASDYFKEDL